MRPGPTTPPSAANSFTSPAPVRPNACPGSMSTRPKTMPSAACASVAPPIPKPPNTMPTAAIASVSAFGTRRVRRSITAAVTAPAATVAMTIRSDGLANALPEDGDDRVAERRDAGDRDHRDERGQQAVLEKILSLLPLQQPSD